MTAFGERDAGRAGDLADALGRVLGTADAVSRVLLVAVMAFMVAIVSAQVFCRYALGSGIDWADETSRLAFVWVVFLAAPHAVARGGHVGIGAVVDRLPHAARAIVFRLTAALGAALMGLAAVQAAGAAADTWEQLMPTLTLSSGAFYVPLALGSAHAALHLVRLILTGRYDEGAPA